MGKQVLKQGMFGFATAILASAAFGQEPPQTSPLGRLNLVNSGPAMHDYMIGTFSTPSAQGSRILMSYPNYHESSAVPWVSQATAAQSQNGIVQRINLRTGTFVTGSGQTISLPKTVRAVRVLIKLKAVIEIDRSGYPAYAQTDIVVSAPSQVDSVLTPVGFQLFRQNHLLHCETKLWVQPHELERNIRHIEATIPVELNKDGEPQIAYLLNYGIYNYIGDSVLDKGFVSTWLGHGPSRGYVEMAMNLVGWYD